MIIISRTSFIVKLLFSLSAGAPAPASAAADATPAPAPAPAPVRAPTQPVNDPLLLRAARGEPVEHTPVWMMRQAGRHMKAYRDLVNEYPTFRERSEIPEIATEISLQPYRAYGVDGVILFSDILTPLPAMGIEFDISEGGKIKIQPIRTRNDFAKMKRIDVETACPFVGKALNNLRREVGNSATVLGFVGLPFTLASYVVEGQTGLATKFAEIKRLAREDPDLLHDILGLLATNIADYACYQIDKGAQIIQCFDSWAGHLPDDEYDKFALPYQKNVINEIKRRCPATPLVIYMAPGEHSKGGRRLLKLAATGADIVSVDHTIDLRRAKEILPHTIGIQGNLDPTLLRDGPLESIRQQTEQILEAAKGRKHIMNLGHGIEPDTPEEHAAYFVQTVQNYR